MAARCPRCRGSGVVTPEAWEAWVRENSTRPLGQETPAPTERIGQTCVECLGAGREISNEERGLRLQVVLFVAQTGQ